MGHCCPCFEAQQDAEALWCHRYVNSDSPAVTGRRGQKQHGTWAATKLPAIAGIGGDTLGGFTQFETKESR